MSCWGLLELLRVDGFCSFWEREAELPSLLMGLWISKVISKARLWLAVSSRRLFGLLINDCLKGSLVAGCRLKVFLDGRCGSSAEGKSLGDGLGNGRSHS